MHGSVRSQLLQVQVQVDGNREMSDQHADFAIELNEIGDASVPDRCSARKSFDERSCLERYTPRRPKSIWSQINREHVAMRPPLRARTHRT